MFEKYTLYAKIPSSKIPNWVKIFWHFCFAYTLVQNHLGKYFLNTGISDMSKSKRGWNHNKIVIVFSRQLVKTRQTLYLRLDTSCKKQKISQNFAQSTSSLDGLENDTHFHVCLFVLKHDLAKFNGSKFTSILIYFYKISFEHFPAYLDVLAYFCPLSWMSYYN